MTSLKIKINEGLLSKIEEEYRTEDKISSYFDAISQGTLMAHLGIKLIQTSEDYLEAEMQVDEKTCQTMGCLHGGASMALGESLGGFGSHLLVPPNHAVVGIQISGNHLAMVKKGESIQAKAYLLHQGRSMHLWQIDLINKSNGRMVSSIRLTNNVLPPR